MHKDYLKMAVHNSLTKDLPSGLNSSEETCECGSSRRWRPLSPEMVKPGVDKRRGFYSLGQALARGKEEERGLVHRENSELHLSHVSRGAQRLTQMIGTSSSVLDGSLDYFPEDLLRGALDLQESLVMLSRLQDISQEVSRRRSNKLGLREERGAVSKRYGNNGKFQELPVDQSSRNCSEELKKLITDSFRRQNHLPDSCDVEKASSIRSLYFDVNSTVEEPSFEEKLEIKSSPSLITKLMGLKEVPVRTILPIKSEGRKNKTYQSSPRFVAEFKSDQTRNSLEEIFETRECERLQKTGDVVEAELHFPDTLHLEPFEINSHKDEIIQPIGNNSMPDKEKKITSAELMRPTTLKIEEVKKIENTTVESFKENNTHIAELSKKHRKNGNRRLKKPDVMNKLQLNGVQAPFSPAKPKYTRQSIPDKRLSPNNNIASSQISASVPAHNLNSSVRPMSQNSTGSAREKKRSEAKPVRKSTPVKGIQKTKKDARTCEMHGVSTKTSSKDNLLTLAEQKQILCNKDNENMYQNCFGRVMTTSVVHVDLNYIPLADKVVEGEKYGTAEEYSQLHFKETNIRKPEGKLDMKQMLLGSQSFRRLAQGLFGLDTQQPMYYQKKGPGDRESRNKLLLDCGKELLTQKSYQQDLLKHPMMISRQVSGQKIICASLEQLAEEISDGIQKLISYVMIDYDAIPENSICVILERELLCKEMSMDIVWHIGWRNLICVEEVDRIVGGLEEQILACLVDEIVSDLP